MTGDRRTESGEKTHEFVDLIVTSPVEEEIVKVNTINNKQQILRCLLSRANLNSTFSASYI